MEKNFGIIVKKYSPHGNKIVVFDRALGKVIAITQSSNVSVGSVVRSVMTPRNQLWFMSDVELVEMPLCMAKHDILFLHHILEVCYYFLPLAASARSVFDGILMLYALPEDPPLIVKKSMLFKFYLLVGLYADEQHLEHALFSRLSIESVDTIAQKVLELGIENKLTAWLQSCIAVHPHARYFKTMHFLQR